MTDGVGPLRQWTGLVGPALGSFVHAGWLRLQTVRFTGLSQDLSFAVRAYGRAPTFTLAAVLTLGLGIAANVAVFTVASGALFAPYPYAEPERLAMIASRDSTRPGEVLRLSYPDVVELGGSPVFESIAAYDWDPFNIRLGDRTEWVEGGRVSSSVFETLGLKAIRGRGFRPADENPGAPPVAILGERLWRGSFGGDEVVGRTVWLDGEPFHVVGIAPSALDIPEGADVWVPLRPTGTAATRRSSWLRAIGRLAPGVTWPQARAALDALGASVAAEFPDTFKGRTFDAIGLRDYRTGGARPAFVALLVAVGVLLLIVCANLTSLMLARASDRSEEFALRRALGASRARLFRQLITESFVLASLGGALGLLVGLWAVRGLSRLAPDLPNWFDPGLDPRVIALATILVLLSALLFGLPSALRGAGREIATAVRHRGTSAVRSRDVLLFAEVALSTVLLLAAAVLIRTWAQLNAVDPGFSTEGRISGTVQLPDSRYADDRDVLGFIDRVIEGLEDRPDVVAAGAVTRMPFRSGVNSVMWWEEGQGDEAFRTNPQAELNSATPGYFEAMGIELRRGRWFGEQDRAAGTEVVIINESMVREHFADTDPIGRRISFVYPPRFMEIVGVVEDVKHEGLDREWRYQIYAPFSGRPTQRVTIVAWTRSGSGAVGAGMRQIVRQLDPDVAVSALQPVEEAVRESLWRLRLLAQLFWAFGIFALLLASVGIGGLVAQLVAQRTREFGIRMALGARPRHILALVGRRVGWVLFTGLAAGGVTALLAGRFAEGVVHGVGANDPATYAIVLAGFALLGLLSAWLPARRATSVDAVRSLRAE